MHCIRLPSLVSIAQAAFLLERGHRDTQTALITLPPHRLRFCVLGKAMVQCRLRLGTLMMSIYSQHY